MTNIEAIQKAYAEYIESEWDEPATEESLQAIAEGGVIGLAYTTSYAMDDDGNDYYATPDGAEFDMQASLDISKRQLILDVAWGHIKTIDLGDQDLAEFIRSYDFDGYYSILLRHLNDVLEAGELEETYL